MTRVSTEIERKGRTGTRADDDWPLRPAGEVCPPVLDSALVAQLLCYDLRGCTLEQGRRNVRNLVKAGRIPVMGRVGSSMLFERDRVIGALKSDEKPLDGEDEPRHDGSI